jgi:hypothetical protein
LVTLYVEDIDHAECPMCHAKAPTMLFPTPHFGYRFWCGACNHEEPILMDEEGRWYWMVNRADPVPVDAQVPVTEGAV